MSSPVTGERGGERARLPVPLFRQHEMGTRAGGEGGLLALRRDRGRSFDESAAGGRGKRCVAAEVLQQQLPVDADVKIEHARAEAEFADEAGTGILLGRLEVIDGGVIIVLHRHLMRGDGVRDLHRRFAVELRIVGQHPPEHGDVSRGVRALQNVFRLQVDLLAGSHALGQRHRRLPFLRRDEGELLGACGVVVLFRLQLAEMLRDRAGNFGRFFRRRALRRQFREDLVTDALRANAAMVRELLGEHGRRAPRALQRLAADAQTRHVADRRRLRAPRIVAVEIGGRVEGQQMELQEVFHASSPSRTVSSASGAAKPAL